MKRARIAAALVGVAALAAAMALVSLRVKYRGFAAAEVFVEIPRGAGTFIIGQRLASAGVVRYAWQLALVRLIHPRVTLEAGEYRFAARASTLEVFARLARGDVFYQQFTVPEGADMFDIARLAARLGLVKAGQFLMAARDASLIRDLDPAAPTLEGYLFPSTYRVGRRTTGRELCRMMTAEFRKRWRALAPAADADVHAVVTLASLVEKETPDAAERPVIAGVFKNRLARGMPLDCDPTTIYAALLDRRFRGAIHRSDLDSPNTYNTYRHAGLPPGPIANPGAASLAAALAPAATPYLYFVARADGSGHRFSRTIEEHNQRVREYRRATR